MEKTCKQLLMENLQMKILVRKQNKQINMHKNKLYLTWVEMGHHALAHGSTSLLVGGAMAWRNANEGEGEWVV